MDTCRDIEMELVAYCSDELDPLERDLVQSHLEECSSCRDELAREIRLRESLGSLPVVCIPHDLEHRIQAATHPGIPAGSAGRFRGRLLPALVMAAASLAVALLLPALRPASNPGYSEQEIASARADVLYTLALTAKVINNTQKDTVIEVFADKIPTAINESFKSIKPTTSGGNG